MMGGKRGGGGGARGVNQISVEFYGMNRVNTVASVR